jgi:pimeloyl-ACP methyl ester carboxylesterase
MSTDNKVEKVEKEIWFLHGANATPASFNYIKKALEADADLDGFTFVDISYDCQEKLPEIVKVLAASAPKDKQVYIIGHSLGGVLGVAISQRIKHFDLPVSLRGVISLASPFGGSESADYLKWLYPHYHLFRSISTQNRMIVDLKAAGAVVPTLSLVTTSGNNPLYPTANDGVVTVNSQRALPKASYIEMPCNHFEVLVNDNAVEHIKLFLKSK